MMPECVANDPEKLALRLKLRAVDNEQPVVEALSSFRHLQTGKEWNKFLFSATQDPQP